MKRSEDQLQPQLKATRIVRPSRASNAAKRGGRDGRVESIRAIRIGEPDAVEGVDELGPELQPRLLGDRRVLNDRKIEAVLPGITHRREPQRESAHGMITLADGRAAEDQ